MELKKELMQNLKDYISLNLSNYPKEDLIKIDLHCHDYNSNKTEIKYGDILGVPESYLESERLIEILKSRGNDAFTITNHNNAKSCYALQEKGFDIITATEFTCHETEYNVKIHVLAYGFTKEQEDKLQKLKKNIYNFLKYTKKNNIPTIWAHPLYFYATNTMPPIDFSIK